MNPVLNERASCVVIRSAGQKISLHDYIVTTERKQNAIVSEEFVAERMSTFYRAETKSWRLQYDKCPVCGGDYVEM